MLKQIISNQYQSTKEFNARAEGIFTELNRKFEALSLHIKKLDVQGTQTADAVKHKNGVLPEKVEDKPKSYCNAISKLTKKKSWCLTQA